QIADGAKQGAWAEQNRRSGAVPPAGVPTASSQQGDSGTEPTGGTMTNVSYEQVRPSGNLTQLQQNGFSIAYPDNWKVAGDQNSVTIAPPAGVAGGAIAYGVVIGAAQTQNADSLDQATQNLIQALQRTNPGLKMSGSLKKVKVSGVSGRSANLVGLSPIQQNGNAAPERDWLITVPQSQGGLLYFVFIAPQDTFSQIQSTYRRM